MIWCTLHFTFAELGRQMEEAEETSCQENLSAADSRKAVLQSEKQFAGKGHQGKRKPLTELANQGC